MHDLIRVTYDFPHLSGINSYLSVMLSVVDRHAALATDGAGAHRSIFRDQALLITHNVREFSRVPGLRYDDWEV